jgi:hypothetical protein
MATLRKTDSKVKKRTHVLIDDLAEIIRGLNRSSRGAVNRAVERESLTAVSLLYRAKNTGAGCGIVGDGSQLPFPLR